MRTGVDRVIALVRHQQSGVGFFKLIYLWQRNRKVGPAWKLVLKRTSLLQ